MYIRKTLLATYYYDDEYQGALHRIDGPAIEYYCGDEHWYLNGVLHREDGPAIDNVNGNKEWYLNGKRHREDGPAFESYNGYVEYYLNDKQYICSSNEKWSKLIKTIIFE